MVENRSTKHIRQNKPHLNWWILWSHGRKWWNHIKKTKIHDLLWFMLYLATIEWQSSLWTKTKHLLGLLPFETKRWPKRMANAELTISPSFTTSPGFRHWLKTWQGSLRCPYIGSGLDAGYIYRIHEWWMLEIYTLGILAHLLRMVMEPEYLAFWRWLYTPQSSSEKVLGSLGYM